MSAVDFGAWARPDLVLTLGPRTFTVREPSVGDMRQVLALAVRAEVGRDQVPPEIIAILDTLPTDGHPALGDTYTEMVDAGVGRETLARIGVYATLFWAYGRKAADSVAERTWGQDNADTEGSDRPKGSRSGRTRTGRSTASVNPSTPTNPVSRSTRTTGKSPGQPKRSTPQ